MAPSQMSNYSNSRRTTHACEAHMLLPSPGKELQDVLSLSHPALQADLKDTPCSQHWPLRGQGSWEADSLRSFHLSSLQNNCPLSPAVGSGDRKLQVCVISLFQLSVEDVLRVKCTTLGASFLQRRAVAQPASAGINRPPCWGEVTWLNTPQQIEQIKSSP